MSDKFEKLSIYDVDIKLKDEEGVEYNFTFKPLPFATYPKVYPLLGKLTGIDFDDKDAKKVFEKFDEETVELLSKIELEMVLNSYPDMELTKAQNFVMANMFDLIEVLVNLTFKQEKGNTRKMEQIKSSA